MGEQLASSLYFGATLSLGAYCLGLVLFRLKKSPLTNPLLIANVLTIAVLLALGIDYAQYNKSAQFLNYLLTPATICLAVPMYEQLRMLRQHLKAVLAGILAGVFASFASVLLLSKLFGLSHVAYLSFLPKSITTAIGIAVSEQVGGLVPLTVAAIIITGLTGNVAAEFICRTCKIDDPVARGIGIGTSAHAVGTARALEMGVVEGAMSSLSIVVAGLLTAFAVGLFAALEF